MGNIRGFNGPLSRHWLDARKALNLHLLARMRGLGMRPALSAFAGHVPATFAAHYPHANISRSADWANFDRDDPATAPYAGTYILEPTDPLFLAVGRKFIEVQTSVYNTDHIYQVVFLSLSSFLPSFCPSFLPSFLSFLLSLYSRFALN